MATVNQQRTRTRPTTHEGGFARHTNPEQQLRRTVLACLLWEDNFYESGVDVADRIRTLAHTVDPETVAALAIEARERFHLRHVPLLLVRELARSGGSLVGETLSRVIQRPDEITEFLAIYWMDGKEPISNQVKKGLAEAFHRFDEYQFAKYDRKGREIRLRDVMFLVHPTPQDEEEESLFGRIANDELKTPDTWEVAMSSGGDPKREWTRLLREQKLGGLALLRNLRNMEQAGVERGQIQHALENHPFPRVLPFRFIAAAKHAPSLEPSLETGMYRALSDMPKLEGKTAFLFDASGSMTWALSARGTMTRMDAAAGVAIMLRELCDDVDVIAFGSSAALVPSRRGFGLRDAIRHANVGHATYANEGKKIADKRGYDRIVVISDMQTHDTLTDPVSGVPAYAINVGPYQNGIGYGPWTHIDGWSNAVIDYIREIEDMVDPPADTVPEEDIVDV